MIHFLRAPLILAFLFLSIPTWSQGIKVYGTLTDSRDNSTLIGVSVILVNSNDSTKKVGLASDNSGQFLFTNVTNGSYILKCDYLGYKKLFRKISVNGTDVNLGNVSMEASNQELKNVVVQGKQARAEQIEDTIQYHADAFKTHKDATAEDLVTKMPGVSSDNTGVKVNGETVQQVYVDGKQFFGTDPTLALRNLPSEVIDKIQVFDRLSDQSLFTGFDDGNTQKTMNIITKRSKSEGQFGKVFAGYGTDGTFLAGGNMNFFNGDQRISILELSNNINQQNFSSQDILGISGASQNRGGMGGGRGNFGGGGGSSNNFMVGQQAGITNTNSAGINYTDVWGKKIKVTASYFFNNTNNSNATYLDRSFFAKANVDSNILYGERDSSISKNSNHRFNMRLEYTIDSFNTFILSPSLSLQENYSRSVSYDSSRYAYSDNPYSLTYASTPANSWGYSFNNNALLQHKFKKRGRTISLNVANSLNEKSGDGQLISQSFYSIKEQQYNTYNHGYSVTPSLNYTEPLGKKSQLMINYTPSYSKNWADKETDSLSLISRNYSFDSLYSNKYSSTYNTQKGGLSYRFSNRSLNFMLGLNMQQAILDGKQIYPDSFTTHKVYNDLLPTAMYNYRWKDGRNLRIIYRTNISAPSVSQLQDVVDISNPQLLKTGNANLIQDYEQTLIIRYGLTKAGNAHNFFLFVYANYINNYIGNQTLIPTSDSVYSNGIIIRKGNQLSLPVNLNGYFSGRSFLTYSIPFGIIKSNLNLNLGLNYSSTPGMMNSIIENSYNTAPTAGVVISSNISENVDFTFAYSGTYNFISSTLQTQTNNNYYNHTVSFKINYIIFKNIVLNTNLSHGYYSTLASNSGTESLLLWNAYIGYKFLKNKALEARFTANDILNQNKSINRTVGDTYIENSVTQVLKQYFMFSLTYTLRNFKNGMMPAEQKEDKDNHEMYRNMYRGGAGGGGQWNH
jgi:hypothetical protein